MTANVNGSLTVSDDVLADLVGYAAKECYGVVGMSAPGPASAKESLTGLLPHQRLRRGIEISRTAEGGLRIVLHVILEYGVNIPAVSRNLVDGVQYYIKNSAQIEQCEVEVRVEGMKVRES